MTSLSHSPPLRVTILLASTILSGLELSINGIIHYVLFQMWLLPLAFLSAVTLCHMGLQDDMLSSLRSITTRICYNFPSHAPWGTWCFCVGSRSPASSWGQGLCCEAAPHAASSSATAGSKKPDQGLLRCHRPFCHLCPFPRAQPKDPHPLGPTMSTASSSPLTLTPRESLPFGSRGVVLSL